MRKKYILLFTCLIWLTACSNNNLENSWKVEKVDTNDKISILEEKVNRLEKDVQALSSKIDDLQKEGILKTKSLAPEEVVDISKKLEQKLKPYNSYIYKNTLLPNYEHVVVHYGTWKDYSLKKEVSKKEIEKWVIIFKNLKDNTRYYYKIYWDGQLLSDSYFETAKKPIKFEIKWGDNLKSKNWKVKLSFEKENVKWIKLIKYRKLIPFPEEDILKKKNPTKQEIEKIENIMKGYNKKQESIKWKILKNINEPIEITWLDDKKSYEWQIIYEDIYNQTWILYFVINQDDKKLFSPYPQNIELGK